MTLPTPLPPAVPRPSRSSQAWIWVLVLPLVGAMFENLEHRHSAQRINFKIPRMPLTVHEEARVGRAPVSPKVTAILVSGLVIGGSAGLLLGIVIAGVGAKRQG